MLAFILHLLKQDIYSSVKYKKISTLKSISIIHFGHKFYSYTFEAEQWQNISSKFPFYSGQCILINVFILNEFHPFFLEGSSGIYQIWYNFMQKKIIWWYSFRSFCVFVNPSFNESSIEFYCRLILFLFPGSLCEKVERGY